MKFRPYILAWLIVFGWGCFELGARAHSRPIAPLELQNPRTNELALDESANGQVMVTEHNLTLIVKKQNEVIEAVNEK